MSAPVTERSRVRTAPRPTRTGTPAIPAQRGAPAAQRAYAKRDERLRRLVGGVRPAKSGPSTRRAQFVLFVMVLLGVGLVLTLWLSTAAAADSYRLQDARTEAGRLTEQVEQLRREVAVAGSAPELARRAAEMGMVPVQDPARLVAGPDGTVTVVGDPVVARAPAPPVVAAPPAAVTPPAADPDAVDPALAAGQAPAGAVAADPAAAASDGAATDAAAASDTAASGDAAGDAGAADATASDAAASDAAATDPAASDPAASDPAADDAAAG